MQNFEKRFTALEKSNARYRLIIFCMLTVITYFTIIAFSPAGVPEVVQAKKFEVVDDRGNVLVRLENYNGSGAITTFLPNGNTLTDIVPTKSESGGIVLYDGKGKKNMTLTDVNGGGGSLVILNPAGQNILSLGRNNLNSGQYFDAARILLRASHSYRIWL